MDSKIKYRTKQRQILLSYLESIPGVHITAGDVCDYFEKRGTAIGQTTVYRQLERLVDEGVVNKYIIDGNSPACFEFVPDRVHHERETCYHAKCEKCGKLIHLNCEEIAGIRTHLQEHHQFLMDMQRTVFYGVCEACSNETEQE